VKQLLTCCFLLCSFQPRAQEAAIREGNKAYRDGNYTLAERHYQRAGDHPVAQYNRANALIRQNRFEEALALLAPLTVQTERAELRQKAFYNSGVIYSKTKALEESIEAYKSALRLNPADRLARENLQKALLERKQNSGGGGGGGAPQNNASDRKLQQLQDKEKKLQQSRKQQGGGNEQGKDW